MKKDDLQGISLFSYEINENTIETIKEKEEDKVKKEDINSYPIKITY